MRMSAEGALETKNAKKIVESWSKAWLSGMTARVFYPIFWEDGEPHLLIYGEYGHKIAVKELKSLKRIFIPTNSEVSENGRPIKPDFLFQFSRVAKLIKEGQKLGDIKALSDSTDDKEIYATALKELEEKYKNLNPVVGPLDYLTVTEAVFVPLTPEGKPDLTPGKVKFVSQELSADRLTSLIQILKNSDFRPEDGVEYIEVQYAFGNENNRQKDGRVTPTGVAESAIATSYAEEFKLLSPQLSALPKDSNMIKMRNNSFTKINDSKIERGVRSYAVLNSAHLNNLTSDEDLVERVKKSVEVIAQLKMKTDVIDVQAVLEERNAELAKTISEDPNVNEDGAPTLAQIEKEEFEAEVAAAEAGENKQEGETFDPAGGNVSIPGM